MTEHEHQRAGPVDQVRIGAIIASIWENASEHGSHHTVQIQRIYRKDDMWRYTGRLGREDLLTVAKVADLAHTRILERESSQRTHEREEAEADTGQSPPAANGATTGNSAAATRRLATRKQR